MAVLPRSMLGVYFKLIYFMYINIMLIGKFIEKLKCSASMAE